MNNSACVILLCKSGMPEKLQHFSRALCLDGLEAIAEGQGLVAYGAPDAAHLVLAGSKGLVWGHLFDTAGRRIDSGEEPGLLESHAEQFVQHYWGGYVAVRVLPGGVELLRDPSGAVACYVAEIDGVHIVTSRPDLLFAHGLLRPQIDWTIVTQSLAFSDIRPARTALRGVSELLPGMAATLRDGHMASRCAWSPWPFADTGAQIRDRDAAIAAVRETALRTLGAWGRCFTRPMLEISGGLDSSIVAAGLRSDPPAASLTFGPAPGDPDERPFARAVAARLGISLQELAPDIGAIDITHSDAAHLPRPCARAFSRALDRPIQALVRSTQPDAFIGGGGGDNVFCHLQSALPLLDRLIVEGPTLDLTRTASEIARQSRTTVWKVMCVAGQRWGRRHRRLPRPKANRFLSKSAMRSLPWPEGHPWLRAPAGIPPGKKRHGWSLIGIQNHVEGYGREKIAPHLSPLLSQPIMETCLRVPSWLWLEGGNNRTVAREAFRELLPPEVIDRRTKGGFDTFAVRLIEANRQIVNAMLLEGSLAREGLLDRDALHHFLEGRLNENEGVAEVLTLIDTEAWLYDWERRTAAAG